MLNTELRGMPPVPRVSISPLLTRGLLHFVPPGIDWHYEMISWLAARSPVNFSGGVETVVRVEHLLTKTRKTIRILESSNNMDFTRDSATERAKQDLSERLGLAVDAVRVVSITDRDFPDMSLGAATDGEMSAQMISTGWEIQLKAEDDPYEYRADKFHLRLVGFEGENHIVE